MRASSAWPPPRAEPMRVGNLVRMLAYARTVRRSFEESGQEAPGREIALPGLANAESQVAVPAMVLGQLVGVLAIESTQRLAFGPEDEALLTVLATLVASAIEIDWAQDRAPESPREPAARRTLHRPALPNRRVTPTALRPGCASSPSTAARSWTAST